MENFEPTLVRSRYVTILISFHQHPLISKVQTNKGQTYEALSGSLTERKIYHVRQLIRTGA